MTRFERWHAVLTSPEEPDAATCVSAAALLAPTYATVNIYEVRDAVRTFVVEDQVRDHTPRLLYVAQLIEATAPDAPGRADVECLVAYALLGRNIRSAEAWATNGDVARTHLNAALTIEPGHTLALLMLHTQHVSGGLA